ncbi:GerAB/ArcD/ProY family transporter [Paenibacillus xylanexedens]|uniref:GerAB/ArcD/ProY family transporter n=1 Tax=Paenibacillus xylanexedens TaxID=528191 RepID=UPI0011A76A6C|nr:endospore germination permease [Paenibacillus xylanexedens]
MLEHGRLGMRQLTTLTIMTIVGDMLMIYPSVISLYSEQNAWLYAFIGIPLGMGLIYLFVKLASTYPGENLVGISRKILGFWPGTLVSLFYLIYFILGCATPTRIVGDFMTGQIFVYTPIWVIILIFVIAIGWALHNGLETIGRTSEILVPVIVIFIFILVVCLLPQGALSQLEPYVDSNIRQLTQGLLVSFVYPVGEAIPILMILPYASQQAHRTRDLLFAAGFANFLLALLVTISMLVMGLFLTQHNVFTSFALAQKISIGNFFQRIEAFMASSWLISTYFKCTVYLYAFVLGTAELFRFKNYQFLILPSVLILFGLANFISSSTTFIITTITPYWFDWDMTASVLFPVMLLIVHQIRTRVK